MIDTHCHLYDDAFSSDFEETIGRAKEIGVGRILLPNIELSSWMPLLDVLKKSSIPCYPMLGLHPCYVKADFLDSLAAIKHLLEEEHQRLIAIGEIGMDLYWDKTLQKEQELALREQINWALSYDLPIALHVREAFDPLLAILSDYTDTGLRGVFHCFTGNEKHAEYIIRKHPTFYFGIGGVITYKNHELKSIVKKLPLNRLLLETDAPYLPPTPHRGKRNEPSFLKYIVDGLALALETTPTAIIEQTNQNAELLFDLR